MVWSIRLYRRRRHDSEEKYRLLFVSGPDTVFVLDSDSLGIIDANTRTVESWGYEMSELLSEPSLELDKNVLDRIDDTCYLKSLKNGFVSAPISFKTWGAS